ncbi:MAG: hypothetical protein V4819_25075 [Verrucomicrobiota bacterium]
MPDNPYEPPAAILHDSGDTTRTPASPGGIRRLTYWISVIVLVIGLLALIKANPAAAGSGGAVAFWIVNMVPAFPRLKNIGMNPWLSLAIIIPIVNLFIIFRCLAYQENYQSEGKLDRMGETLIAAVILVVALIVFLAIFEAWSPIWLR